MMRELKTLMEQNYRDHPAFNCGVPSLDAPVEKIAAFNDFYSLARNSASVLSPNSRVELLHELRARLNAVFDTFHAQSADDYELRFLYELKQACNHLLDNEYAWYARPRSFGFVELSDAVALRNTILLQSQRYFFGRLPKKSVVELQDLAERELTKFRANAVAGKLTREDLSINSGPAIRKIRDVLNREFKTLGVLDAISSIIGRKTRVLGLALELSVPKATWWRNAIDGLERAPQTLYSHLDETIACPKSIVYLSDVTEQNGPTSCYPGAYEAMDLNPLQEMIGRVVCLVGSKEDSPLYGYYAKSYHQSANSEKFRRHFMRLPECLRFNSHMGWDVLPCSELEGQLVYSEQRMTGPAGTFIAFDGARLLHRGGMVEHGERLALQVIFSDLTLTELALSKLKRMMS